MRTRALLLLCVCASARVRAQCPDGTPPPCARASSRAVAPPANSVAVLYFDNLSRDTADAFLADGLTEELMVRLSQVRRLDVKSRFESQRVRGRAAGDPRALGRSLHAAYLVTGTMQQADRQVRLRVSLVRTADGSNVWSDVYDRAGGNILQIQSEIAREVASAITGQLLPAEQASLTRRPTEDPIAYQFYLRGVGAGNTLSEAGLRAALDLFNRAIERDSSFADAWAQKSVVWLGLADGYVEGRVAYLETRVAAERALRHDSGDALGWALLGEAVATLDRDVPRTELFARRAIALDPRQAIGHSALGSALYLSGHAAEGLEEDRRAWLCDTLFGPTAHVYLEDLYQAQNADEFARVFPRMQVVLDDTEKRAFSGLLQLMRGDAAGALERLDWHFYGGQVASARARALVKLGRAAEARAMADSMVALAARGYYNAYGIAQTFGEIGDADRAFDWLRRADDQRTVWILTVRADPAFTAMRGDPRWTQFLNRMEHP